MGIGTKAPYTTKSFGVRAVEGGCDSQLAFSNRRRRLLAHFRVDRQGMCVLWLRCVNYGPFRMQTLGMAVASVNGLVSKVLGGGS